MMSNLASLRRMRIGLTFFTCYGGLLNAAPVVLADTGQTQPLSRYLNVVEASTFEAKFAALPTLAWPQPAQFNPKIFPVRTPALSPGPVTTQVIHLPQLERPVFIIGFDSLSKHWLTRHRARLLALHAVGMVVNVANARDFAALKQAASVKGTALPLYPLPGTALASAFKLTHYPVFISASRIEQ